MSFYSDLLKENNGEIKPIWQYRMQEGYYQKLKEYFASVEYWEYEDARDCASTGASLPKDDLCLFNKPVCNWNSC